MHALNDILIRTARTAPVPMLLLWAGGLLAIHSPHQSFMPHDEGFYAQQAQQMLVTGDWITQARYGTLFYDRAMGLQWLIAVGQSVFGYTEFASRLPVVLASLASVLLTFAIGRRIAGPAVGLLGAAILTATPIWMQASWLATQDVPLTCAELLGIWALLRAEDGPHRRRWGLLAGMAFGAGFALKSFMVLPAAAALLPYLFLGHRRHRHLSNTGLWIGVALGLLPTALWLGASAILHGALPLQLYFAKLVNLAAEDFHNAGPFYYLWNLPATGFPWPLLAVPGAVLAWRDPGIARKALLIGFPLVLLVVLSVFSTRVWYYALQLLPMLSLLAAVALGHLARRYLAGPGGVVMIPGVVLAGLGTLLIAAAGVVAIRPDLVAPNPGAPLALLGLLAGAGLCAPFTVLRLDRRRGQRNAAAWVLGWLAGPWLAIAVLFGSGLWGNYSAGLRDPLRLPPLSGVLAQHTVDVLLPVPHPGTIKPEALILEIYRPHPGTTYFAPGDIPDGAYVWVHASQLAALGQSYRQIGTSADWTLVQIAPG